MNTFVVLAVVVGAAFAAPYNNINEAQRIKKSYGAPVLTSEGALGSPLYLNNAPVDLPHYRVAREEHNEDVHQAEHARSYYDGPASAASAAALAAAASAAGAPSLGPAAQTFGVFPGAKLGGCAVPILLSCAPSIHHGHIAPAYAAPAAAPALPIGLGIPAYRTEGHVAKMRDMAPEKSWSQPDHVAKMREMTQSQWSDAERSSQMRELPTQKQWVESPLGVKQVSMNMEPLEPHQHHHHGDFHMHQA